ncbi:AraC family transcriptional regulator [Pedobacter polaris]|uniref:AraC family transcriptional regulator n=1 Tax=Pedobacter polaris TaxID=2571273 RepID=A0A4V5NZY4_9SPHI|nr:helix-turn-helix domain-containing protein [Pedobacter polaris]TKC10542.1 AraC family transcriptional regulator [Pedobacter polaris]
MLNFDNPKWTDPSNGLKDSFRFYTVAILFLSFINIAYKIDWNGEGLMVASNLWNPLWLLLGPALYLSQKSLLAEKIGRSSLLHLLPFMTFGIFFVYLSFTTDMSNPWENTGFAYYQDSYGVLAISLMGYAIRVLIKTLNTQYTGIRDADALIISLSIVYILISLVLFLMFISWRIIPMEMGFDYRYLSYGLLIFANLMLVSYWLFGDKDNKTKHLQEIDEEENEKNNTRSALTDELADDYSHRITSYFENTQVYLNPNITIDILSKELMIPKHDFSRLFNIYFEKNFHNFIAEYRIMHAIALIKENHENLKIESLASSCGFNSKASFFKHFKDKTGLTPAEYRLQLGRKSA